MSSFSSFYRLCDVKRVVWNCMVYAMTDYKNIDQPIISIDLRGKNIQK